MEGRPFKTAIVSPYLRQASEPSGHRLIRLSLGLFSALIGRKHFPRSFLPSTVAMMLAFLDSQGSAPTGP